MNRRLTNSKPEAAKVTGLITGISTGTGEAGDRYPPFRLAT